MIEVVVRAFSVLRCFEDQEVCLGNAEISRRCALPPSTVSLPCRGIEVEPVFRSVPRLPRPGGYPRLPGPLGDDRDILAGAQSNRQIVFALRFFYGVTLGHDAIPERVSYARQPSKLPVVLSADEVVRFLEAIPSLKSRTAPAAGSS